MIKISTQYGTIQCIRFKFATQSISVKRISQSSASVITEVF